MAKIPAGVGPRYPQVVVLFGATGDLSRRKLLPGLFHLASSGLHSRLPHHRRLAGRLDAEASARCARAALDEFSARKVSDADWERLCRRSSTTCRWPLARLR